MKPIDYIILLLVAAALLLAVRSIRKRKKEGRCCGSCNACSGHCKDERQNNGDNRELRS